MDPMRRPPWFTKKTFQILIPLGMLLAVGAGVFWRQNAKPVVADRTPFAKGTAPRPSDIHLDAETEQKIRDLIEQLASKNPPPSVDIPAFSEVPPASNSKVPAQEEWIRNERVVYDAYAQLTEFGKTAFPILLENLGDR